MHFSARGSRTISCGSSIDVLQKRRFRCSFLDVLPKYQRSISRCVMYQYQGQGAVSGPEINPMLGLVSCSGQAPSEAQPSLS
jgi:hypothetical protein